MKRFLQFLFALSWMAPFAAAQAPASFLAVDNGANQLLRVDPAGEIIWNAPLPPGARDLHLLPGDRILVSHRQGMQTHSLETGEKIPGPEATGFRNIQSALPLDSGFVLAGAEKGATLLYVLDGEGHGLRIQPLEGLSEPRLIRSGPDHSFLLTSAKPYRVVRLDSDFQEIQSWPLRGKGYTASINSEGVLAATNGATVEIQRWAADGTELPALGGKESVPGLDWFSGFAETRDHFWVANWMGHLPAEKRTGPHVVVYDRNGDVVWTWSNPDVQQVTNVLPLPSGSESAAPTGGSAETPH